MLCSERPVACLAVGLWLSVVALALAGDPRTDTVPGATDGTPGVSPPQRLLPAPHQLWSVRTTKGSYAATDRAVLVGTWPTGAATTAIVPELAPSEPVGDPEDAPATTGGARVVLERSVESLETTQPTASPVELWMEKCDLAGSRLPRGVRSPGVPMGDPPGGPSPEEAPVTLAGANFPICNVPTDVSRTEALDRSSVAYNPQSGEYFVVWHATTRASSNNIYGRFVSAAASPLGAPFAIAETAGIELAPSVAYDATANQYWVAWTDLGSGSTGNIHLRRLSPTGAPLGSDIVVNGAGPIAFAARVAWGAGRCMVVWNSDPGDGNAHILLRAYDAAGTALTPGMLLSDAAGKSTDPDISFNPTDQNFLVVWSQQRAGTGWDVKSLGITADVYSFSPQTISSAPGDQKTPRIGFSAGAGRYLVVWYDGRSQQTWDIYGRLVGRDGVGVGGDISIYVGAYTDALPVVAGSGSASQFAVAYQSDISGATQFQILASIVSGSGEVGNAFVIRQWYNARTQPAIALRTGFNEYLVTFTDDGAGTQPDIQGQVARGDGTLAGSLITVARGRKGQEAPRLTYDPAHGEYLSVWADYRTGSDYDLYARRVSATGDLLGQEVVAGSESALYGYPAVAYDSRADEYLAVWQEVHSPPTGYDIYARRIGWAGDVRGSAFLVSRDTATINEGAPRVVYNPTSDEYLVTWHAFTSGKWRIYGQRVSPAGQLVAANFVVSASTGDTQNPHVAWNGARNEYLLAWQDLRNVRVDIYAQRLSAAGALLGGNFAISTASGNKDGCDGAYSDAANDYLVVWGDARSGGSDIYAQRVDATGTLVGADFQIANSSVAETAPVVAYDAVTHGYLVAYWRFESVSDWDVWTRFVPGTGAPSDPSVAVATATEVQNWVELTQNTTSGEFLAVWQDFRAGSYNIYGQRLNNPGSSGCSFSLSATSQNFTAAGGTGTVGVTAPSGCAWSASSGVAWITVTGGASGSGNGTVSYSVASNPGDARAGTLTIAGQTFAVSQDSQSCAYSLSVSSANFTSVGGNGSVAVTAPAGCPWTASTSANWIHITGGSGTGSGTLYYSVDANSGPTRSGTISLQGLIFTVNQSGTGASLPYSHWIAAVSHVDGASSSHWRSDVAVLNRSSSQATVEYRLYTPSGVSTQQVVVAGNAQDFHRDITAWLGLWSGSGSLEVRSSQDIFVMGRTYNQVDSTHTYGQNYDGQDPDSSLLSTGQSAWLPLLSQTPGFRCNIAITNAGTTTASVTLALYDGQGNLLWSGSGESSAIASGGFIQYLKPFQKYAGRNDIEHGYARVTVNSGSNIIVWASVMDENTGDPTTIFMKR